VYSPAPGSAPSSSADGSRLIEGPRWYRNRIRWLGPVAALLLPGALGAIAYASLQLFDTPWSGAVGLVGGYFAAPTLLAVGAPFADRSIYPLAVAASGLLWFLVGLLASRRATRNPMATWSDFWRHYCWMLVGIWTGVAIALAVAMWQIGDSIVDW
jgi:hypothetical protein